MSRGEHLKGEGVMLIFSPNHVLGSKEQPGGGLCPQIQGCLEKLFYGMLIILGSMPSCGNLRGKYLYVNLKYYFV